MRSSLHLTGNATDCIPQNKRDWATGDAFVGSGEKYCVETVYGKTVGMLVCVLWGHIFDADKIMQGYGHVGPWSIRVARGDSLLSTRLKIPLHPAYFAVIHSVYLLRR